MRLVPHYGTGIQVSVQLKALVDRALLCKGDRLKAHTKLTRREGSIAHMLCSSGMNESI
jgi:hypothetical protein